MTMCIADLRDQLANALFREKACLIEIARLKKDWTTLNALTKTEESSINRPGIINIITQEKK